MTTLKTSRRRDHYFAICTDDGYVGEYETREEAEHERRLRFGIRALAHPIAKVSAKWNPRPKAQR